MKYKEDWEQTKERFIQYWAGENHERALISLTAKRESYSPRKISAPDNLRDRWLDTEYIIRKGRETMASTCYVGESFPMLWPNLGPDILGATLGCGITFQETTSYAEPTIENWDTWPGIRFDEKNPWWKKIVEMTEDMAADAGEDYFVGITDLHPGADALVSLRSPGKLCLDLFDYPDKVKQGIWDILPVFKRQLDTLHEITVRNIPGSSNWMEVWHPEKWYVTSCDFISMISTDMFEEFVLPELIEEIDWLKGKTLFHLDGPNALKHLDRLLEIPNLAGVQWVYGAGQPTASSWIQALKKIQDARKLIFVDVCKDDIAFLLEELKPEGVMYRYCDEVSESEARDLLKTMMSSRKKKVF